MIPHGDMHYLGNGSGTEPVDGEADLPSILSGQLCSSRLGPGDGGERTQLICGYLVCDERLIQPLLAGLPRVLRVSIRADPSGELLESMVRHAVAQATATAPGSRVIAARLAEVLFAEVLRRYLSQLPPGRVGWLAGAGDPAVGRALAALHQRPAHAWTLDELAQVAALSRSSLTERFARYLEQGPMAYLANWRLELAAESLRSAFKRSFSVPAARYRKAWRERAERAVS